jgi:hypothetical protein
MAAPVPEIMDTTSYYAFFLVLSPSKAPAIANGTSKGSEFMWMKERLSGWSSLGSAIGSDISQLTCQKDPG